MKKIFLLLSTIAIICNLQAAESITITKTNPRDPSEICNNSTYNYTATLSGLDSKLTYTVEWVVTNGAPNNATNTSADVKWIASSTDNIGKVKAKLKVGDTVKATSSEISVTIKSIQHIMPGIAGYDGGVLTIDPCNASSLSLEATQIIVPGTGDFNPETVFNFKWTIPKGWTLNGQVSDGSTEIGGDQAVTVSYPASAQGGTIKVRGYHSVSGCGDLQHSQYSKAITVKREINFVLNSNKEFLICGDTNPVTYTVSPTSPCAVYYWNNSTTATTNNSFQYAPNGTTNPIVTVKIVYADKEVVKPKTLEYRAFAPGEEPDIEGPSTVCMSGTSFFVPDVPSNWTIIWETSSRVSRTSPQGANPCIFTASGNGSYEWIKATITNDCGNVVELESKNVSTVWSEGTITQNGQTKPLCTVNFVTYGSWTQTYIRCPGSTSYSWQLQSGSGINWNQTNHPDVTWLNLYLNTSQSYGDFRLTINTDDCGTIMPTYHFIPGYMYSFSMSPNPATDEVTITRVENVENGYINALKPKKEKFKEKFQGRDIDDVDVKEIKRMLQNVDEYTVKLYDERHGLIKSVKTKSDKQKLDLRGLPAGEYFLHIENEFILYQEHLIVR